MRFFLGTHCQEWLWDVRHQPRWPWFVSHRRLARCKTLKPAVGPWALDSGGFTELRMYGEWRTTPAEYVRAIARYADEIGRLEWAAPQDWMCEPSMLAKTGKTVAEHQALTVANLLELRSMAPQLPIVPVLQGWEYGDYMRHAEAYDRAGIGLGREPLVGMGTFCRRARMGSIAGLVGQLAYEGVRMHAFGLKADGLSRYGWALASADSMAWSHGARHRGHLCSQPHRARSCTNCRVWAEEWAERATVDNGGPVQLVLV